MTKWYVKDLSKLTNVSVQTLHHYDRIGLLKPSFRLANGYRLYSEKDLLKLQQIVALKFFGFELAQIKTLLTSNVETLEHFSAQAQFLETNAKNMLEASKILQQVISESSDDKSVTWQTIIKLIEVYHMTQQLQETWVKDVLTQDEQQQYANFRADLKTKFTEDDQKAFRTSYSNLIQQISSNINESPSSDFGINIAKQIMDLINGLYGRENINLRLSIWENGFKKGKIDDERFLAPEIVIWLDKATEAYYTKRINDILAQAEHNSSNALSIEWSELMDEIFGDSVSLKHGVIEKAMNDNKIGKSTKEWLKQFLK